MKEDNESELIPDENINENNKDCVVVGIGASAGGVQALKVFFENVPEKSGIAYVVILHLSPDHDSKLTELIQAITQVPVIKVLDKTEVKPDHIYVISPNQHLMMMDGQISVSQNIHIEDRRAPVDIFFRTLADSHRSKAVCVILSGTGANGSMGLKRIKEMGGAAFVQNPREAEYNEMPRNSIATGLVDDVLSTADIPKKIIAYKEKMESAAISIKSEKEISEESDALQAILSQVKLRTGHDFSNYKRPTLLRRIERRINIKELQNINEYASYIKDNPDETVALLKDLLISVTNFFRDKRAFDTIEIEIIPYLLRNKTTEDVIRIWIAGCATGEEAYSFAMMFAEKTSNNLNTPRIQIFATDIDESAIAQAREGFYTINDAADISPERLQIFFIKENGGYRVRKEIRELILFANHNMIKDPPFRNVDLISCRNVLIYLNRKAQDHIRDVFHFSLNNNGFLFMGTAEAIEGFADMYSVFIREHHIFQKRNMNTGRTIPFQLDKTSTLSTNFQKLAIPVEPRSNFNRFTYGSLHHRLLEQYAPPSIIVNEIYDIVHVSENAGRYLQIAGGEPTNNIIKLIREELKHELRSALYQASKHNNVAIVTKGIKLPGNDKTEYIQIHVRTVLEKNTETNGFILIVFEPLSENDPVPEVVISSNDQIASQLEEELIDLKNQLRRSDEELRSAAEELETSKEELQSINEELRTVNQELKVKVEETAQANNNMRNLISSVDIGTIFLDRSLRIAFFTPATQRIFNLIPSDIGRSLSDITNVLHYDDLTTDSEAVLERLQVVEHEVRTTDDKVYVLRMLPYRTPENRIDGVVLTFFDVTARKKIEEALQTSEESMKLLLESATDYAIFTMSPDRRIQSWNKGAEKILGYTENEIIGESGDIIFLHRDRTNGDPEREIENAKIKGVEESERVHLRKDGSHLYGSGTVRTIKSVDGKLLGFVKILRDLTIAKQLEVDKFFLASIVESSQDAVMTVDFDMNITSWNSAAENLYGYSKDEALGKKLTMLTLPKDLHEILDLMDEIKHDREVKLYENIIINKNAVEINLEIRLSPIKNKSGEVIGISTIARDITERKMIEKHKQEFIGIASHELKTPVTSIKAYGELLQELLEETDYKSGLDLVEKMNSQVDRMTDLIHTLLDSTRISDGRLTIERSSFDLNQLISERIKEMESSSHKHRIMFRSLPVHEISGDRKLLGQVINNLISNAFKYSPDGGNVIISTRQLDKFAEVKVQDSGVGIPNKYKNQIFERFFRIPDSRAQTSTGMGLGLYITAAIIKEHGGMISVESSEGKGSVFSFSIPTA